MKSFMVTTLTSIAILTFATTTKADPCPFDGTKTCTLYRNILTDIASNGLKYYASTNYDHRMSGEINVYDATLVTPYTDSTNAPGQLKLIANKVNSGFYKAGEIMTRINLNLPPYNSPVKSNPWTTKELTHGYVEVVVKMPICETSDDGLCQAKTNPASYNAGLWPAIWMEPTMDANWPQNGEIDIAEAYLQNTGFNHSTATLHFNGGSPRCTGGDCVYAGFNLGDGTASSPLFNNFHKWGFEWQSDPNSSIGGVIITGYFDNLKIWGPLTSDSLPVDGPGALSRGFGDPNGGYYLIVNLAIGGPYAGAPNSHLTSAGMYIQSIKVYNVGGTTPPPIKTCLPPTNIIASVTPDKKQVVFSWTAPSTGSTILNYQVNDWLNRQIWKGNSPDENCFADTTLPGTAGKFVYFFYTNCESGQSTGLEYDLVIP